MVGGKKIVRNWRMMRIIKNYDDLITSELRKQALIIAESGYEAIDTEKVVRSRVLYNSKTTELRVEGQRFVLKNYKKVTCIGVGKVALAAMTELQKKLGSAMSCGFVIDLTQGEVENLTCRVGTHPFPTEVNVAATKELLDLVEDGDPDDLVIFIISGGASSLLCYPNEISCDVETSIIKALTKQGATITELNTVRKHISKVKGGQLAKLCYPATVISLIFSDVPGNQLDTIASGPTVKDTTRMRDAARILDHYNVLELCKMPSCQLVETPKEDKYFEKVHNILLVSPEYIVEAMKVKARDLGWKAEIYSTAFEGEASVIAREIVGTAKPKTCLIGAGEATVKIHGDGLEGRCQVMAVASLSVIRERQVFLPLASDGEDHSDAAGAIVDSTTKAKGLSIGLDPEQFLANNDSYHYLESTGNLVFTGKTGSNVSDFFVLLTA
jgi:glycerate-2-kinase